jgi:cytochrome c
MPHHRKWLAVVLVAAATGATASEDLARKAGCSVCHAVDRKGLGPSYKDIAAKYKGDAKAPALLVERVRQGSKGVWGQVPMTPTPPDRIGDADLKALIAWVLKQ